MESKNSPDFLKSISEIVKQMVINPFTEQTKKRQTILLIFSFLSILSSMAIIEPSMGTFFGIKFLIVKPFLIQYVLGSLTAFFLIIYISSCYIDLGIFKIHSWDVKRLENKLVHSIFKQFDERSKTIEQRIFQISKIRNQRYLYYNDEDKFPSTLQDYDKFEIADECKKKKREIDNKIASLKKPKDKLSDEYKNYILELENLELDRWHYVNKLNRLYPSKSNKSIEYSSNRDRFSVVKLEIENINDLNDSSHLSKMNGLTKSAQKYRRIKNIRNFIEITFPIILALFALYQAFGGNQHKQIFDFLINQIMKIT